MAPAMPGFDAANGVLKNAIFTRNSLLKPRVLANCADLFFSQLRRGALFPAIAGSMGNAIRLIVGWSVPSQVVKTIVSEIAVVVATLLSCWAWANKGRKNKAVYSAKFLPVVFPKIDDQAPARNRAARFFQAPICGANISKVRNFVKPFEAHNWAPDFSHRTSLHTHSGDYGIIP